MKTGCEDGSVESGRWDEALDWYNTILESDGMDFGAATDAEWRQWCTSPDNRRIFYRMSRLLADRNLYRKRRRRSKVELDEDGYDVSLPIADWHSARAAQRPPEPRGRVRSWWWLSAAISVAATAMVALFVFRPLRVWSGGRPTGAAIYQTSVGGLRDVHLSDGSDIVLGGRTKLSVAFSAARRSVNLIEGQAWFKVAHDPSWPFMVTVNGSTITDVGTAFVVTVDSDRVFVTVTEGTVAVSGRPRARASGGLNQGAVLGEAALAPINVTRGEELSLGEYGVLGPVTPTDTHAATAWVHGRLIFYDMPLRYVVEAVNRYSSRHIVVGSAAGALRFGGVVYDNEIEDWLKSLEAIFPVTVSYKGATVGIQMRYSPDRPTVPSDR